MVGLAGCAVVRADATGDWGSADAKTVLLVGRDGKNSSYYTIQYKERREHSSGACEGEFVATDAAGNGRIVTGSKSCGDVIYSRIKDAITWHGRQLGRVSADIYDKTPE